MTAYAHTTFGDLKSTLAARRGDPGKVHWVDDELGLRVIQALRVFNAVTGFNRRTDSFTTTAGTAFYDLTAALTGNSRAQTITDNSTIRSMQYHVLEPMSPTSWTGTEMWTLAEFVDALERRRNMFLAATACTIVRQTVVVSPGDGTFDLPDTTIAIRRMAWVTTGGAYSAVYPSDEYVFGIAPAPMQQQRGVPTSYSTIVSTALTVQLYPPPEELGTVDLLTVTVPNSLDPTANTSTGTLLLVPNDVAWGVEFGALADLLRKDGPARDPARAEVCEWLYQLSIEITRALPTVLTASINGVVVPITTATKLDGNKPGWQGKNRGAPRSIAVVVGDSVLVEPVPDGVYSIGFQLVQNALVPTSTADDTFEIQLGREDLEAVLAWADMLAAIKSQGASLELAQSTTSQLIARAHEYNQQRLLQSTMMSELYGRGTAGRRDNPTWSNDGNDNPSTRAGGPSTTARDRADHPSTRQSRTRSNATRGRR
jgi:hypothetical protein